MTDKLTINICPIEPRATVDMDLDRESGLWADLEDCTRSGDVEPACAHVLAQYEPEFTIWDAEQKTHRTATAAEVQATCEAIYFESESDFTDQKTAETYLIWEAASNEVDR